MSVSLVPYLNFPSGKTREAMTYYQDVFGGELSVNTFAEFGMEGMPPDGVMHAQLITDQFTVMASDAIWTFSPVGGDPVIGSSSIMDARAGQIDDG